MYRRVMPLAVTIAADGEYSGHEIIIGGTTVAYRTYNGADTDDVQTEVAEAIGSLVLARLRERHPSKSHDGWHDPGTWLSSWEEAHNAT